MYHGIAVFQLFVVLGSNGVDSRSSRLQVLFILLASQYSSPVSCINSTTGKPPS